MAGPIAGSITVEILGDKTPIIATLASLQTAVKPITVRISAVGTQQTQSQITGLTAAMFALNNEVSLFGTLSRASFNGVAAAVTGTSSNVGLLNAELNTAINTIGRMTAAWQLNGSAARASGAASAGAAGIVGALGGVRGAGGLNGAALAASFISPTAGLALMAAQMGPIVAGAAAAAISFKFIADSAEKAAEFQRSMKQIGSISGETTAQMNDYSKWVVNLSTQVPIATGKLAEMSREAVLVGLHGEEGMKNYTSSMAAFAIVTRDAAGNLGETAKVGQEVVKILRSTGASTEEVNVGFGKMINGLIAIKTTTGLMIPEVTTMLKYFASQGEAAGLSINQMTALAASLVQTGARAQGAGGAVAKFFDTAESAAATGGAKLQAWARVVGLSAEQAKELLKNDPMEFMRRFVSGATDLERSGTALSLTLGSVNLNSAQVRRTMAELANALPLVSANMKVLNDANADQALAFRKMMDATDNYKDKVTLLGQGFDALKMNMGMAVLPGMTAVLEWALSLSHALNDAVTYQGKLGKADMNGTAAPGGQTFDLASWLKNSGLNIGQLTNSQQTSAVELLRKMQGAENSRIKQDNLTDNLPIPQAARDALKNSVDKFYRETIGRLGVQLGAIQQQVSGQTPTMGPLSEAQQRIAGTPSRGFNADKGKAILKAAKELGVNPNDLAAIISFESSGTFDPSVVNKDYTDRNGTFHKGSGATGLIQFMPQTAQGLGTTTSALAAMTFEQQMEYVVKYFKARSDFDPKAGLGSLYSSVTGSGYRRGSKAYEANRVWDTDNDGVINRGEAVKSKQFQAHVANYFPDAESTTSAGDGADAPSKPLIAYVKEVRRLQEAIETFRKAGNMAAWQSAKDSLAAFTAENKDMVGLANEWITSQAKAAKQAMKDLGLSDSDWSKYKARATELVALQAKQASGKLNEKQSLDATQAIQSFQSDPVKAKAFQFAEQQASAAKALAAEQKRISDQAAADKKKSDEETAQRLKTATTNQKAADQALADGRSKVAAEASKNILAAYDLEVAKAGSSASAKLLVEQAWQSKRLAAMNSLSRAEAQGQVTNLEQERNRLMNAEGVTKSERQALWAQYADRIAKINQGLTGTLAANQQTVTASVKSAQTEQAQVVQANAAKVAAALQDVLANPDQYRDGARGLTTPLQVGLKELMAQLPKTDAEAQKYIATLEEMEKQGLVSAASVAAVKAQVASFGVEARVAAGEFDHIADGASEGLKTVHYSLSDLEGAFPATADGADGFGKVLDELYASGSITNEMLLTMKLRLDALRESQSFDSGLVLENARNGAYDNVTDGARGLNGANNATLSTSDQNKAYLNLDLIRDATNALNEADFDAFLKGAGLAQEDIDSLTASWKAFNEQINKTLDDINAHPEQYADGARGLPSTGGKGKTLADAQKEQADAQRLQSIQDSRNMADLESQHTLKLVSEEAYINKREALQKVAALHAFSDSVASGETYKIAAAQLQADLTKIEQDGLAARAQLATANDQKLSTKAATSTETFISAQKTLSDAYRTLGQAAGETVSPNQALIDQLTSLYTVTGISKDELTALIAKLKELDQQTKDKASLDSFVSGIQALGSAFSSMGGGADLFGKSLSAIGTGVQVFKQAQTAVTDTKKAFGPGGSLLDMLGAAGEWGQIAATVINVIGGIGDAILNLSPAFQAWKKGLLEVADAEKQAMGSKSYGGNSILNPYYEALKKDSDALTTKANAGFWQRVGWALFGGAPETLDKAQSDALTKAGTIFNDFAGSLYGAMESALMSAFDSGNFDGVAAAVEKSLNQLVAKMYLQTLIAKSKIGDDLKMLADDQAAGKDITADLARLKADVNGVTQQYEAGSKGLPGFGAGATDSTSGGNQTVVGAGPSAVYGALEVKFPDSALTSFQGFSTAVPVFAAASAELRQAVSEWRAFMSPGTVGRSGNGMLV